MGAQVSSFFSSLSNMYCSSTQLSGKKSFLGIAFLFSLWYNTMRWLNGTGSVDDMGL